MPLLCCTPSHSISFPARSKREISEMVTCTPGLQTDMYYQYILLYVASVATASQFQMQHSLHNVEEVVVGKNMEEEVV